MQVLRWVEVEDKGKEEHRLVTKMQIIGEADYKSILSINPSQVLLCCLLLDGNTPVMDRRRTSGVYTKTIYSQQGHPR